MRIFKIFFGSLIGFCSFCMFISWIALNGEPDNLILAIFFAVISVLLFKKTKKDKARIAAKKSATYPQPVDPLTDTYTSNNPELPFTIMTNHEPEFPKYPNEDTDIPGDNYVYDKTGKLIGRSDGNSLNDADAAYLVRAGYKKKKKEAQEMMSRGFSSNIITSEILNPREALFFDSFTKKLLENNLNPGYVHFDRLASGAFNVYYYNCYVGKIFIPEKEYIKKYRVLKEGNTRATRVFDNETDAQQYILNKVGYSIEVVSTQNTCWMQCLKRDGNVIVPESADIYKMIDAIPIWINYINYYVKKYTGKTLI